MATPSGPGLTRAEGRRFAWTVAVGFAVAGAALAWRGRQSGAAVLWSAAVFAALAGVAVPSRLGAARRLWMRFGVALSRITAPVFFGVLYALVVTPLGFLRRTLGRSPLERSPGAQTFWVARDRASADGARSAMERKF